MVNQTLKDLATLDLEHRNLCIKYPKLEVPFELKYSIIHLLPIFRSLTREDLNKHLEESHVIHSSTKSVGITKEHVKLRAFIFSLEGSAKE